MSSKQERYHCFHCNEDLHYRVFCRHKEEFYNAITGEWQLLNNDEDSNDSYQSSPIEDDSESNIFGQLNMADECDLRSPPKEDPSTDVHKG